MSDEHDADTRYIDANSSTLVNVIGFRKGEFSLEGGRWRRVQIPEKWRLVLKAHSAIVSHGVPTPAIAI